MEKRITFLVDSNIWLERLLDQEKSNHVKLFLESIPSSNLAISDFTLHSIGVILFHLKKPEIYTTFLMDIFVNEDVQLCALNGMEHADILHSFNNFKIDFDDSYQYLIAKKYGIPMVSFDKDFKKTDIETLEPLDAIKEFNKIT
jgi:predicted nucleic acid-binding protein